MTDECEHVYELGPILPSQHGAGQRYVTFVCTKCAHEVAKHTEATDEELAAELAAQ